MRRFLSRFIFHPFLWALYPPLDLLGRNIDQLAPGLAVRTILVSVLMAGGMAAVMRFIFRDWDKAAVTTSVLLIAFYSYGHVYNLVEDRQLFGILIGRHRFLAAAYLVFVGVVLTWVWKQKNARTATQAFSLIGLVMVLLPLYQIGSYSLENYLAESQLQKQILTEDVSGLRVPEGETPPDIYYIILDAYTRADVLAEKFDYANEPFLDALASRGFYTASCSQSNYSSTALSLTTSLNMNYLLELDANFSPPNKNRRDLYPYLWNSKFVRALEKLGYQVTAFDSGYSPTEFYFVDEYYSQETDLLGVLWTDGINPYEAMVLDTSAGLFVYETSHNLPEWVRKFLALETSYIVHRNRILYTLNRLERLGSDPGPKFVFVHILAPHNPFVFGPNGEHLERETPFTLNDDQEVIRMEDFVAGYRDQVSYLNQRVLTVVDALLQESAQPPIILIQGDHGVRRLKGYQNAILNTYYLPDGNDRLYETISPVNSFRVILNTYFGASLDLLPDESCASRAADPYRCTPVRDPNPDCSAGTNPLP